MDQFRGRNTSQGKKTIFQAFAQYPYFIKDKISWEQYKKDDGRVIVRVMVEFDTKKALKKLNVTTELLKRWAYADSNELTILKTGKKSPLRGEDSYIAVFEWTYRHSAKSFFLSYGQVFPNEGDALPPFTEEGANNLFNAIVQNDIFPFRAAFMEKCIGYVRDFKKYGEEEE